MKTIDSLITGDPVSNQRAKVVYTQFSGTCAEKETLRRNTINCCQQGGD